MSSPYCVFTLADSWVGPRRQKLILEQGGKIDSSQAENLDMGPGLIQIFCQRQVGSVIGLQNSLSVCADQPAIPRCKRVISAPLTPPFSPSRLVSLRSHRIQSREPLLEKGSISHHLDCLQFNGAHLLRRLVAVTPTSHAMIFGFARGEAGCWQTINALAAFVISIQFILQERSISRVTPMAQLWELQHSMVHSNNIAMV